MNLFGTSRIRGTVRGDVTAGFALTLGRTLSAMEASSDATLCPDGPQVACRLAEIVVERERFEALLERLGTHLLRRERRPVEAKRSPTRDGVRVAFDGWFLVRPSGTEPVVPVTVEGKNKDSVSKCFVQTKRLVRDSIRQ